MIERLETTRLALRKARPDDLEAIWRNVWSDAALAGRMLWQPTFTREEAEARLERTMAFQREMDAFFVCLKDTDEPIGFAGVRERERGVWEECGICVAARWQGRGLGREILSALVRLVFEQRGGEAFLYSSFHDNLPSIALCRSLGFRFNGGHEAVREWDGRRYICEEYVLRRGDAGAEGARRDG